MPKSELVINRSENLTNIIQPERTTKQTKKPQRIINTNKRKQQNAIICKKT